MSPQSKARLEVLPDPAALSRHVADWLLGLALAKKGPFAVSLSGGSTPKSLYALMATDAYKTRFPWDRIHWFWGDERFVPPDDKQSNFRMATEAMLSHLPIPEANVHPVPTVGLTPDQAAAAYEITLKAYYDAQTLDPARPLFDVTLLGLGGDGHTASLFPGAPELSERHKWAAATLSPDTPRVERITLTYPIIESSAHTAFLVEGEGKRAIFEKLRAGDHSLPSARLKPVGTLTYVADKAAAGSP